MSCVTVSIVVAQSADGDVCRSRSISGLTPLYEAGSVKREPAIDRTKIGPLVRDPDGDHDPADDDE